MRTLSLQLAISLFVLLFAGCRTSSLEHWLVGKAELQVGNYDAAVQELQASTAIDPTFSPAYLALAAAYSRQGDFVAVSANLQKFLSLNPDHDVAHLYLAECSLALGDEMSARENYLSFIHKAKPYEEEHGERLVYCYQRVAELAERTGNRFEENLYTALALIEECRLQRVRTPEAASNPEIASLLAEAKQRYDAARKQSPEDLRLDETLRAWTLENRHAQQLAAGKPVTSANDDPMALKAN